MRFSRGLRVAESLALSEFASKAAGAEGEVVVGALSCEWSNGQTEGQINRLKMIKRQMYGRANFAYCGRGRFIARRRNRSSRH